MLSSLTTLTLFPVLSTILLLISLPFTTPQASAALIATTSIASQQPTTTVAGSLFTVNGVTSATWISFTQTFASTPLGTWALGATPSSGAIGLGSIQGTVGLVKTKI